MRTVGFDKTGTLTTGHFELLRLTPLAGSGYSREQLHRWVAAVEEQALLYTLYFILHTVHLIQRRPSKNWRVYLHVCIRVHVMTYACTCTWVCTFTVHEMHAGRLVLE